MNFITSRNDNASSTFSPTQRLITFFFVPFLVSYSPFRNETHIRAFTVHIEILLRTTDAISKFSNVVNKHTVYGNVPEQKFRTALESIQTIEQIEF